MPDNLPTDTEIKTQNTGVPSGKSGLSPKVLLLAVVVIIFVAVGVVLLLTQGKQNPRVADITKSAQSAYLSGDYEMAQEKYQEALAIDKDDPDALSGMISAIVIEGNQSGKEREAFERAKPFIDAALQTNGKNFGVLLSAGYAYEASGDYQKALELYEQALKADQDSAEAWFRRGHALEFLGKRQDAYKDYEKAFSLNPNDPLVLIAKGNMLLSENKLQESFDSFKKASEAVGISNQTKAEALTAASLVRGAQEDFKYIREAAEISKQAVDADPNFSPALAAHGYNLFLTAPDFHDGIEYVEKAIQANPRIAKNYFLLAAFNRADRKYTESINYLKEAVNRTDNDNTLLDQAAKNGAKGTYTYELAKTYSMANLSVDTLSLIKDALKYNPDLASRIREDTIRNNLFKDLQTNKEFLGLVGI